MPDRTLPYLAYRPSAVPWFGDVPAHWEMRRLKGLFADLRGSNVDKHTREDEFPCSASVRDVDGLQE